jgi:hypothetical protein
MTGSISMTRKQIYSPVHILNKNKEPDDSNTDTHCHKRIRIMITLGLFSRKIIEKKKITKVEIDFEGAKTQDGKGTKQLGTEAAHNLPRNVLINGYSTWEYINDPKCNFHPRIKKQIYLTSASTVIVKKEINYIDSQWEKNGLLGIFANYIYDCIKIKIDSKNELELLFESGKKLVDGCKETLNKTKEVIANHEVYKKKKEDIDKAFEKYNHVIDDFDYSNAIANILSVYKLPRYK